MLKGPGGDRNQSGRCCRSMAGRRAEVWEAGERDRHIQEEVEPTGTGKGLDRVVRDGEVGTTQVTPRWWDWVQDRKRQGNHLMGRCERGRLTIRIRKCNTGRETDYFLACYRRH